ncbi:hypothetical protein Ait01nite_020270 [Actinoplanes italicus]|uniref:PKD domain-containing protein n=1 Tax=Actinoplanes italicus TaxID=113567 RepID=A0A2T0KP98_9ACTN|nr:PKD domain-containing protein [Actinoplanes italicus]PRX25574.1 hypothetical protein CLV67_101291 [Actinoplanes italicus]GIE28982.1 hypothetical protein Ait01nite_020270 [Actinoplanes italicus]
MSAVRDTPVKGKMLRLTQLDVCGNPVLVNGWPVHVISKGFVSVEYEPEFDDGDEIEQKNADGDACVYEPGRRRVKFYNVTITVCGVDPELFGLWSNMPLVLDENGVATGMRVTSELNLDSAVAFELWSGTAQKKCAPGSAVQRPRFGYFLLPNVIDGQVTDFTIENGAANFTLSGKAIDGGGWGEGPYDVYLRAAGVVKLTDPIGDRDLLHVDWTMLPPPAPSPGIAARPADGPLVEDPTDATGMTVRFTPSFVPAAPGNTYTVDWGDGAVSPGPAQAGNVSHKYAAAGTYLVTITDGTTGVTRYKSAVVPFA